MAGTDGRTAIEAILARRSVREGFLDRPVPRAELDIVVRCGLAAPSSKNAQPWFLHVVDTKRILVSIADAVVAANEAGTYVPHDPRTGKPHPDYVSTVAESALVLRQVAAAVFIENRGIFSGGRKRLARATPEALRGSLTGYGFELIGLGASVENMWLAANSVGLGVAFMGDVAVAEHAIQRCLGFTGDLVGVLALGYCGGEHSVPSPPLAEGLVKWH